jgi:hypothetical protein
LQRPWNQFSENGPYSSFGPAVKKAIKVMQGFTGIQNVVRTNAVSKSFVCPVICTIKVYVQSQSSAKHLSLKQKKITFSDLEKLKTQGFEIDELMEKLNMTSATNTDPNHREGLMWAAGWRGQGAAAREQADIAWYAPKPSKRSESVIIHVVLRDCNLISLSGYDSLHLIWNMLQESSLYLH